MARKKKQEEAPAGAPAWMATFSDLMNLLLCFFVLLFSMSSVDEVKYAELVASFKNNFSIFDGGQMAIGEGQLINSGVSQLNNLDDYYSDMGKAAESDKEEDPLREYKKIEEQKQAEVTTAVYEEVTDAADKKGVTDYIEVDMDKNYQYTRISISGGVLFNSGKAEIKEGAFPIISKVGDILKMYDNCRISIEGHTDNVPIKNNKYDSNMKLSQDRAYSVWRYLIDKKKLDPLTLETSGRGEYEPIANNGTEAGKSKNRRVEIKIYKEVKQ